MEDDDKDLSWKKPDWTKNTKLRSTGKGDLLKEGGNLAAPITDLPHQKTDSSLTFSKPEWTGEAAAKEGTRVQGDLARPITSAPHVGDKDLAFKKPEWTQKAPIKQTNKGAALKEGKEIARPIGGIKPVED